MREGGREGGRKGGGRERGREGGRESVYARACELVCVVKWVAQYTCVHKETCT